MNKTNELVKDSVLVDVSTFVATLASTGVERMLRAFILNASKYRLIPFVVLEDDRIGILPMDFFAECMRFFDSEPGAFHEQRLAYHPNAAKLRMQSAILKARSRPIATLDGKLAARLARAILCWSYVFDDQKLDFYFRRLVDARGKLFIVVIDFLFWTHFECFQSKAREYIGHTRYLMLLRRARNLCFVSKHVRQVFFDLISKGWNGNSILKYPGGDALGISVHSEVPKASRFVVVGTLEPRKYSTTIFELFRALVGDGFDVGVTFLGGLSPLLSAEDRRMFETVKDSEGPISWIDKPSERVLAGNIKSARALICISSGEGFGAPPVEALSLGVPCIVSSNLPSLEVIRDRGVIVVPHDDQGALREAILFLSNSKNAKRMAQEIDVETIPTWGEFSDGVLSWCSRTRYSEQQLREYFVSYLRLELGEVTPVGEGVLNERDSLSLESALHLGMQVLADRVETSSKNHRGGVKRFISYNERGLDGGSPDAALEWSPLLKRIEFERRFALHESKLELDSVEYLNWLGDYYLGRPLNDVEVISRLGDVAKITAPISLAREFAVCAESTSRFNDPLLSEWSGYLDNWATYELIYSAGDEPVDGSFLRECFGTLLKRTPKPVEWKAHIQHGASKDDTLRSFLLSDEFVALVNNPKLYLWALRKLGLSVE